MAVETTLLLMVGGGGDSLVEQAIRQARQAAALDLLETLLEAGIVTRAVIATDSDAWTSGLENLPVEVVLDPVDEPFHFGQRLAGLVRSHNMDRVLYAGGGSAPLMNPAAWRKALAGLGPTDRLAVTNNLHSSDWIAFSQASKLLPLLATQTRDNALGWVLAHEARMRTTSLPPSAASRFDLDTPADLLIARAHPQLPRHLRTALDALEWPSRAIDGILQVMEKEGGHLAVIGRSAPEAWSSLQQATRCWVRLFVEERGMIASGRMERGEVGSLLADLVEQVGPAAFFHRLSTLVGGVLMDSRVILAARGLWPSNADRFNADLFKWDRVQEPFLRQFSRAASEAGIPILIGGQSVVSGGLMALIEILKAHRRH